MTISIPANRTILLKSKVGGGFASETVVIVGSQRVINGTGFGTGPTVVLFDSMTSGVDGQDVDQVNGPEIGAWAGDLTLSGVAGAIAGAKYYKYGGRLWMAGRDPSALGSTSSNRQGLVYVHGSQFTEFRLSFRTVIPTGFLMPGTSAANTNTNTGSNWKLTWGGIPENGYGPDNQGPDVCIPSLGAADTVYVQGNTISPEKDGDNTIMYTSLSGTSENFFSWYQKPGTGQLTNDGTIELISGKDTGVVIQKDTTANPFAVNQGTPSPLAYRNFLFNAWTGNVPTYVNVLPLWADMYLAVGPNSYAHIILGDAPTLAACTEQHEIPPKTWTDTEITLNVPPWANAPYTHIYLADGTLIENAEGV